MEPTVNNTTNTKTGIGVTDILLRIGFIFSAACIFVFLYIGSAFIGDLNFNSFIELILYVPQILTPLFILIIILLSKSLAKKGRLKTAKNVKVFGLIVMMISIITIVI